MEKINQLLNKTTELIINSEKLLSEIRELKEKIKKHIEQKKQNP